MLPRFIFLVSLIAVGIAYSLQTNELINPVENAVNFTENFAADNGNTLKFNRHKRGWGSIIFKGVSTLTKVASLVLTLGTALTEGCLYYPSICDNKKEIERLDDLIKKNKKLYETKYYEAQKSYLDLKTVTVGNGYIAFYINDTMRAVETIQGIEERLSLKLQVDLPKIDKLTNSSTFERYLEQGVDKLEYRLSDLKEMLRNHKQNALIGILVQYAIEATLNKFVNSFQKAYKQVYRGAEDILASTHSMFWERVEGAVKPTSNGLNLKQKLQLVPKAFKQMAVNFKQSFVDFKKSVLKWSRIKNWKGFKGKLAHSLKAPLASLKKISQFFDRKTNAKFVQNYKVTLSEGIMDGIGIIGDTISQIVNAKQWHAVSEQMEKARESYKKYYDKLEEVLKDIVIDKNEMDDKWNTEIEIFRNISLSFQSIVIHAAKYSNFSDVFGFSKLSVRITPLSKVDFNNINKQSLGSSQTAVRDFLKEIDYDVTRIEDELRAREVLYNNTLMKSEQKKNVHEILTDISSILEFSNSITMKTFGSQLKERDVVCTISILRYNIVEYDSFPLEPFRPRCKVNSSIFDVLAARATSKRKSALMLEIVTNSVKTGTVDSLSKLVDSVHSAYLGVNDKTIAAFGSSITDQDIICMISEKFPTRETYDFIYLDHFRPNCSSLNPGRFTVLLQDASKQRQLANGIKSDLQTCQELKFCPCLNSLAKIKYQSNEADVMRAIKQLRPAWQENPEALFCGPPCKACVHL